MGRFPEDRQSALALRCVVVEYSDFPAVEWTLYFKNEGKDGLPLLKDILALDTEVVREVGDEFVLHGTKGDWCAPDSFQPFERKLEPGTTLRFAPFGGRPTNAAFPYYNLQSPGGGILLAIGWPGQWASSFLTLCYDMRKTDLNYRLAERLFTQLKRIQPHYLGDFYPLTPYSLSNDVWLAWQYHSPETGSGVIQAFRRPESGEETKTFKPRGLDPEAKYELEDFDGGKETRTGRELLEKGLAVTLGEQPAAAVIAYRPLTNQAARN